MLPGPGRGSRGAVPADLWAEFLHQGSRGPGGHEGQEVTAGGAVGMTGTRVLKGSAVLGER